MNCRAGKDWGGALCHVGKSNMKGDTDGWWGRVEAIMIEGNKERIWRHDLEGGRGEASGPVGNINLTDAIDGPRIEP